MENPYEMSIQDELLEVMHRYIWEEYGSRKDIADKNSQLYKMWAAFDAIVAKVEGEP